MLRCSLRRPREGACGEPPRAAAAGLTWEPSNAQARARGEREGRVSNGVFVFPRKGRKPVFSTPRGRWAEKGLREETEVTWQDGLGPALACSLADVWRPRPGAGLRPRRPNPARVGRPGACVSEDRAGCRPVAWAGSPRPAGQASHTSGLAGTAPPAHDTSAGSQKCSNVL